MDLKCHWDNNKTFQIKPTQQWNMAPTLLYIEDATVERRKHPTQGTKAKLLILSPKSNALGADFPLLFFEFCKH
tara:strand:- start:749 stop:970 length:222 start_codon:yes stop_codon:yes gene_type:complete